MSKKINEIESQLRATIEEMSKLNENIMTEDQVKVWDEKKSTVANLEAELKRAKEQEDLNKRLAGLAIRNEEDGEKKDIVKSFDRAWKEYVNSSGKILSSEFVGRENGIAIPKEYVRAQSQFIYRADPIVTTTNSSLIPVTVQNDLNLVTGDDFTLAQFLGIPFYTGLTGTHEIPYGAQLTTSKPTEGGDPSTANFAPLNVELKPETYSATQSWSKMSLLNMPVSIYTGVMNDMQLANERKVMTDLMSAFLLTDSSVAPTATGLTYADMINLTKINYNIGNAKFVAGNDVRVYLEQKPVNSAGIALAWNALNNTVGGRQAIGTDTFSAERAMYANFGKAAAIGIWGTPEMVIDGTTTPGRVKVTSLMFAKPVVVNKYAYKFFSDDASCAV